MKSIPSDDSTNRHQQYQTALMIFAAITIFMVGMHGKSKSTYPSDPGPTIEKLISSIGVNTDCGLDPQRAVFLFEPVDLNRADVDVLSSLKGIGPAIAERIVDYRLNNGNFYRVDELIKVKGIGKRKLTRIRDNVTCGICLDTPFSN